MKIAINSQDMRESDSETIKQGLSGLVLMRRAASLLYDCVLPYCGKAAIICGSGNNGGDGYALAEMLEEGKKDYALFYINPPKTADAAYYCQKVRSERLNQIDENTSFNGFDVIVDCVFGNGFCGEASEKWKQVFEKINSSGAYVISCDLPSGLDANSGDGKGAVYANQTVAVQCFKQGMFLKDGLDACGKLTVGDIGITLKGELIKVYDNLNDVKFAFPPLKSNTDKWQRGVLALMGASKNYFGAMLLATQGACAFRMGAGLTRLLIPSSLLSDYRQRVTEATLTPISDIDSEMRFVASEIDNALLNVQTLGVGCGWGRSSENVKILKHVLNNYKGNLVIDADGLFALSSLKAELKNSAAHIVLTPHINEFIRFSEMDKAEVERDRVAAAKAVAAFYGVVVLLKGNGTIITDGKKTAISVVGSPSQAKGGSGDLLLGAVSACLSRGLEPFDAALVSTVVLGTAAKYALKTINEYSLLPTDTANHISDVINDIMAKE